MTTHQIAQIIALSHVSEPTIRRWLRGLPVQSSSDTRIREACKTLRIKVPEGPHPIAVMGGRRDRGAA